MKILNDEHEKDHKFLHIGLNTCFSEVKKQFCPIQKIQEHGHYLEDLMTKC